MSILHRSVDIPLMETTNPRFEKERITIGTILLFCGISIVSVIVYFASITNIHDIACVTLNLPAAGLIALYNILVVVYFIWPFKNQTMRGDASDCLLYLGIATYAMTVAATCIPCDHNIYLVYLLRVWCAICTCITIYGIIYCILKFLRR